MRTNGHKRQDLFWVRLLATASNWLSEKHRPFPNSFLIKLLRIETLTAILQKLKKKKKKLEKRIREVSSSGKSSKWCNMLQSDDGGRLEHDDMNKRCWQTNKKKAKETREKHNIREPVQNTKDSEKYQSHEGLSHQSTHAALLNYKTRNMLSG